MAAIVACLFATGCAIHPLPEDVTGVPTTIIVRKIRCEAREAVKDNLTQWLMAYPVGSSENTIGTEFANGTRPLNTFRDSLFQGQVKAIVDEFENSAVAYDFSFDMTETNNLGAGLGLADPINHLTNLTIPLTGSVNRMRENTRTFTITDTFLKLLTTVPDDYCSGYVADERNDMYPITGTIGIGEMVHTFVVLSLFSSLGTDPTKSGPPTMADVLKFTTALSAGSSTSTPMVVFTPVGTGLQLANASLAPVLSRSDVHQVTVALSLPPPPSPPAKAKNTSPATPQVGLLVNARGTAAELSAAHTIEQMILRFEIGKSGTVILPAE